MKFFWNSWKWHNFSICVSLSIESQEFYIFGQLSYYHLPKMANKCFVILHTFSSLRYSHVGLWHSHIFHVTQLHFTNWIEIFWELHRITCEAHDFQNLAGTIIFNKILFLLNKTKLSCHEIHFCEHLSVFPHSLHFWGNSLNFFESFAHYTSVSLLHFKCVSEHRAHTQSNCMCISVYCIVADSSTFF